MCVIWSHIHPEHMMPDGQFVILVTTGPLFKTVLQFWTNVWEWRVGNMRAVNMRIGHMMRWALVSWWELVIWGLVTWLRVGNMMRVVKIRVGQMMRVGQIRAGHRMSYTLLNTYRGWYLQSSSSPEIFYICSWKLGNIFYIVRNFKMQFLKNGPAKSFDFNCSDLQRMSTLWGYESPSCPFFPFYQVP